MDYELFNIRNSKDFEKYYPILKSWWEEREKPWIAIDPRFLSSRGMIVKNNGQYVCAAWLYTTDCAYGIINWIITNNNSKPKIKKECLEFMLDKLEIYANILNIEMIYMVMGTDSLKKLLKQKNYLPASNNITEFFKII